MLERAVVDDRAQPLALAERRDPADDVARRALRSGRLGHDRLLRTDRVRQCLEVELPRDGDDTDDQGAVGHREEGLEHPRRVDADRVRGLEAIAEAAARVVLVRVHGVGHARGLEGRDRWGPAARRG